MIREHLKCRNGSVPLGRVAVMGILNVTPDSFSDGGLWLDPEAAVEHAREMVRQGAAIIDVGGESTRPGAAPVSEEEELARVLPVIRSISGNLGVPISIDTRKASVAEAAVEAGAAIINDTTGEATDHSLDKVAAATGAGIIVMHSRGTPATMRELTAYGDVVRDVGAWLRSRVSELVEEGVGEDAVMVDPGIGFAKTPDQNLELLRRLDEITQGSPPVLVGTSRKSFIGAVLDVPEAERGEGTLTTVTWSVAKGARAVRVHDVAPALRAVRMTEAIMSPEAAGATKES